MIKRALRLNCETFPSTEDERRRYEEANVVITSLEQISDSTPLVAYDALLVVSAKVRRDTIARLERCQVIGRYGTGTDNIDVEEATRHGIVVTNVKDFCLSEMADHTMALILALTRRLFDMDESMRTGQWHARVRVPVHRLAGKTLGFIGFGGTARAVARRAHSFDLRMIAYKPGLDPGIAKRFHVDSIDLDTLLSTSDFVSLHVPLTPQTRKMIGEREFRLMKPEACLINTARGGIVEEGALVRALSEGWIAGAGIDVYDSLAVFDANPRMIDHPLFHLKNVILTPHSGGCSVEALNDVKREAVQQVISVLNGKWPSNVVNPQVTPRYTLSGRLQQEADDR
jgi:D-3-phosphoglycerate dehydrogenase